jgi:spore coat polysaccharide biosynthesis protein SpsF
MKQGKIVAIIQARMGSTRLPGKVLKEIGGKFILEILVNRLKRAKRISSIVVATTERKEDDKIVELAKKLGVEWFRGSEDDVLTRFVEASRAVSADIIIRITSDNPLTDPELMDGLIKAHLESEADYTHCMESPLGTSVEVVNRETLERIDSIAKDAEYREHVTLYIREHPELFKIHVVKAEDFGLNHPNLRLTVDTEDDLELMRKLQENLGDLETVKTRGVIEFLTKHPEICQINAQVKQKIPKVRV